jgi:CBS domain-containing membrane protein
MREIWRRLVRFMAIESAQVSAVEQLVAALGGLLGIALVAWVSYHAAGIAAVTSMVPSIGASAVLLFAVPHGRLSQPWSLFAGHLLAALIGVSCYRWIGDTVFAAAAAVALSIAAMHLFACIHPPGGATALAAVIGGPAIHELGYGYLWNPVLLNVSLLFLAALLVNSLFPWRRYPAALMPHVSVATAAGAAAERKLLDPALIERAIAEMDLLVDVTTADLQRLFELASRHAHQQARADDGLRIGCYYSNGQPGPDWSVRQIVDESPAADPAKDLVVYRVVDGRGLRRVDSCTRAEFASWSAGELRRSH